MPASVDARFWNTVQPGRNGDFDLETYKTGKECLPTALLYENNVHFIMYEYLLMFTMIFKMLSTELKE